jgi:hypothetical protein
LLSKSASGHHEPSASTRQHQNASIPAGSAHAGAGHFEASNRQEASSGTLEPSSSIPAVLPGLLPDDADLAGVVERFVQAFPSLPEATKAAIRIFVESMG